MLLLVDAVVVGVVVLLLAGWVVLLPVSVVASLSPLWLGVCELECCNRLWLEECRRRMQEAQGLPWVHLEVE